MALDIAEEMKTRNLSNEEMVCIHHLIDNNLSIRQTEVQAYDGEPTPRYILKKPRVKAVLTLILQDSLRDIALDAKDVMAGLRLEALGLHPNDTNSAARIAAWKLLGVELDLFKEKHEVSGQITVEYVNDWRKLG